MNPLTSEQVVSNAYPQWLVQLLDALFRFLHIQADVPQALILLLWGVILFTMVAVLAQVAVIWMVFLERNVLACMTQRKGPNRVGPFGLLQTLADGIKLLFKEDIMHREQDKLLSTLGPAIFFLPCFVFYGLIPFSEALQGVTLPAGALFIFAISSISVLGIVISGWGSNNKYALLGGMRSAAQAISYEIPLILAVLGVVLYTGTMNLRDIVDLQFFAHPTSTMEPIARNYIGASIDSLGAFFGQLANIGQWSLWRWNVLTMLPVGCLIFFICAIAEVNRIPFDLPEAESELVSGYNTEYSGMKFALFFLAEYAALFAMCAFTVAFFFGGYHSPFGFYISDTALLRNALPQMPAEIFTMLKQLEMISWFTLKTYFFIFVAMWWRATLPRLKPDQLMGFSWKFLLPLALVNIFVITFERYWHIAWPAPGQAVLFENWQFIAWLAIALVAFGGFAILSSNLLNDKLNARLSNR
ncbi:MAG: complex I subunit 1 family protein [Vampirovibrionales bacterium]|nr:complex I subunit 1 family protein [Vampirovibrionales bacterium]